jgi:hypothetical protein
MTTTKLITIDTTPNATLQIMQKLEKFIRWHSSSVQFFFAGGSVRKAIREETLGASDIDIFFRSHNDFQKVVGILDQVREGSLHPNCRQYHFDCRANSPFTAEEIYNAEPTSNDGDRLKTIAIQLIHSSYFDTVEDLMDNFDFTICQMAYAKGKYLISEQALDDELNGVLAFAGDDYDHNRFKHNRLLKYTKHGYIPTLDVFDRVFLSPDALYIGDFAANDSGSEYEI